MNEADVQGTRAHQREGIDSKCDPQSSYIQVSGHPALGCGSNSAECQKSERIANHSMRYSQTLTGKRQIALVRHLGILITPKQTLILWNISI
jgi:hypothetical protein